MQPKTIKSFETIMDERNAAFKSTVENDPFARKKQKIDEKTDIGIFTDEEFGEQKFVTFFSEDEKGNLRKKTYSDKILNVIPKFKGKGSNIKVDDKYIDVLPWISLIYGDKGFLTRFGVEPVKINVVDVLEFINKYMVTTENTFEKLCSGAGSWFYQLMYNGLCVNSDSKFVKNVYISITTMDEKTVEKKTEKALYMKLMDNTMYELLSYQASSLTSYFNNINATIDGKTTQCIAFNTDFDFEMIGRIPLKYKSEFLTQILKSIREATFINGKLLKHYKSPFDSVDF